MTKKEQQQFDRLKLQNADLQRQLDKHLQIYSDQLYELVELRTRLELVAIALNGDE